MSADRPPLRRRRGISLLEVLISMFILLVGLLGVGALIPVGRMEVGEADRYDRTAAVGRAAFREIKVRRMLSPYEASIMSLSPGTSPSLQPSMWMYQAGYTNANSTVLLQNGLPALPTATATTPPIAFCLDPWGLAYNYAYVGTAPNSADFPADAALTSSPYMYRISMRTTALPGALAMQLPEAANIFQVSDDLTYLNPTNGSGPPTQQYITTTTKSGSVYTTYAERRASDGNYSWMVTIVPNSPIQQGPYQNSQPSYSNVYEGSITTPVNEQQYTVSVVVFYKRPILLSGSLAPKTEQNGSTGSAANPIYPERVATVSAMPGGGISGGEITLTSPTTGTSTTGSPGPSYLKVKRGQWIMLAGTISTLDNATLTNPVPSPAGSVTPPSPTPLHIFRWYRVVSADDVIDKNGLSIANGGITAAGGGAPYSRNVTLAGPDWPVNLITGSTFAFICDGVVAVYEKTMPLERTSVYLPY